MAEKRNGKRRGIGKGWSVEREKKGNKMKRGKGNRYIEEGKVSNRVQRGVDRTKSRKNDVRGRRVK